MGLFWCSGKRKQEKRVRALELTKLKIVYSVSIVLGGITGTIRHRQFSACVIQNAIQHINRIVSQKKVKNRIMFNANQRSLRSFVFSVLSSNQVLRKNETKLVDRAIVSAR